MTELVTNAGNMFMEEGLHDLSDRLGVGDAVLRERFNLLRDYYERRRSLLENELSAIETSFFFISKALHILGFTHSHNEPMQHGASRPDFTLFTGADDFSEREPSRGTAMFYAGAIGVAKACGWNDPLDADENIEEPSPEHPGFILDGQLRQTGLQWGILSSGRVWRIYHRSTSGLLNTYYEVNLQEILDTNDFDAFRYFVGVFSAESLVPDEMGSTLVQQILN